MDDYDFLTHQQIKALLLQCGIEEATFFNQVQLDMENWFKQLEKISTSKRHDTLQN